MTEKTTEDTPYQARVSAFVIAAFGAEHAQNIPVRNLRFLEEAIELFQALGGVHGDAVHMADYVFARPVGESRQEVGGVCVTLNALCTAAGISCMTAQELELERCWKRINEIHERQKTKPVPTLNGVASHEPYVLVTQTQYNDQQKAAKAAVEQAAMIARRDERARVVAAIRARVGDVEGDDETEKLISAMDAADYVERLK